MAGRPSRFGGAFGGSDRLRRHAHAAGSLLNLAAKCRGAAGGREAFRPDYRPVFFTLAAVMALCVAVLCCTFAGPGMEGVHRWIRLGPVSLNAAFLCVPVMLAIVERSVLKGEEHDG